jgi:GLPGLI family protein
MKHLFAILFSLFALSGFSQQKELLIKYDYKDSGYRTQPTGELRAFHVKELFTLTTLMPMGPTAENPLGELHESKAYIYKNRERNQLVSEELALGKYYVMDSLNLFQWQLKEEEINIMGYKCRRAESKYRGRDYVVYFTVELPFKAAPWKFHGLPGVVLKAYSKDKFLSMEAVEIKTINHKPMLNPYRKQKFITWDEYAAYYKKGMKYLMESSKAEDAKMGGKGQGVTAAPPNIEIIMKGNRRTADDILKEYQAK